MARVLALLSDVIFDDPHRQLLYRDACGDLWRNGDAGRQAREAYRNHAIAPE